MKSAFLLAITTTASLVASCGDGASPCERFIGTYSGTFGGTVSGLGEFEGTVTLVVTSQTEESESANLEGTWTGPQGFYGDINRADLRCTNGTVNYEFGLSLKGPNTVVCPSPCEPGSSGGGCYCNGATLGAFTGTFGEEGGAGTWRADSGAAQTIGATGGGSWTVTR